MAKFIHRVSKAPLAAENGENDAEKAEISPIPISAPSAEAQSRSLWLIRIIKVAILTTLFLAPLFYLPFSADILLAKAVMVEVAAVAAGAAWLLNVLVVKRVSYKRSPLNAAFLAAALVILASTIFSPSPWSSFWGSDPTGEKAATLLSFIVLSFVAAAVFQRGDARRASSALLLSFSVLGAFVLVSIFAGYFGKTLPSWLAVNPIGTLNALALVLAAGFVFSFVLALTRRTSSGSRVLGPRLGWLAAAAAVILFLALLFIGFKMLWLGIGVSMLLLIAFNFAKSWPGQGGRAEHALGGVSVAIAFLVLAASLFFSFRPVPLAGRIFQPPLEISPAFQATLAIGAKALKSNPALGMGPANFRLAFNQFRDPALNNTIFWQTRFSHGFSFLTTLLATLGVLGVIAFLGLVVAGTGAMARAFWKAEASEPHLWALGLASVFLFLEWLIYASNFTASFLLFLFLGLAGALWQEGRQPEEAPSWWRITRRTIMIDAPALNFAASLAVVFSAAFSLLALYGLGVQYAAEVYFSRASRVLNLYGNTDTAKVFLSRAAALNPKDENYYQGQAQVALVTVGRVINQAAADPNQDLSGQFRAEFSEGINAAQRSTALGPANPDNWFLLGQLYEMVIPFIPGADGAALGAYERASQADPPNPALKLAKARVLISAADLASLQAGQAQGEERERLDGVRKEAVKKAHEELDAAIGLKADYAPAHFLLAQTYIREGNVSQAIRKVEETAVLAPQDVGVAFQLGFLYYRNDELAKAEREFQRAVAINENYSNARYFLGLIYDRRGDKKAALNQFQKIAEMNPGNEEVARIAANLRAGRKALEGIVPPAAAPEERKEAPVEEKKTGKPVRKR